MEKSGLSGGMAQVKAPLLVHRRIAPDHYLMRLKAPGVARRARPGQFVHVRCRSEKKGQSPSGTVPLLRRPLSLFDADPEKGTIDFIYKVVGLGTRALSQVPPGSSVDFLGPLGRPFTLPEGRRTCYLVGGGVGIPPLYILAKWLLQKGVAVEAFLGARTKGWVLCVPQFRQLGVLVHVATDDGTLGHRGSVVDLLRSHRVSFLRKRESGDDVFLYICGPTPMMAAGAALARRERWAAQVCLEERMGCAMGCCMGCVVEVTTEPASSHARFQRVCTEGPVFPAEAVLWK